MAFLQGLDSEGVSELSPPLPLRAHALLCLLGFRGEGYSDAFVRRMRDVLDVLEDDPSQRILLRAAPGTLCEACPHLDGGCTLQGPEHEAHVHAQDQAVLSRLGLQAGDVSTWADIRGLIATNIEGADLHELCTTCPWLSLGWCQEGVDALREKGT